MGSSGSALFSYLLEFHLPARKLFWNLTFCISFRLFWSNVYINSNERNVTFAPYFDISELQKQEEGIYPKITDRTVSAPDNLLHKISKDKELLSRPPVNIMNTWSLIYFLVGYIICTLFVQLVEFDLLYFFLPACRPESHSAR